MKILVLVDYETVPDNDPQFKGDTAEVRESMEFHVIQALRKNGHEVKALSFGPNVRTTMDALIETAPEIVFNLTEHFEADRCKDVHITTTLELLHIPYTGTGPTGLMLCRDKAICKRILGHHRIRIPRFSSVPLGKTRPPVKLTYPLVAKPVFEDGSEGIALASVVNNDEELQERIRMIHERMKQPVICEEFIEGRELYVGIIGNRRLRTLPTRELKFGNNQGDGPRIATSKVKWDKKYRNKWNIHYTHAELSEELEKRIARVSKRIYRLLQLRDYGRIDLRLTPDNQIVFLEANPNPDLSTDDEVAQAAIKTGIEYNQLIERILKLAMKRYRLKNILPAKT